MAALSRWLLARCVLPALCVVCVGGWCWAVWRLAGGRGGPEEAMALVLGWGLGLLPVHVSLRGPWSARRRSVRRLGGNREGERERTHGRGGGDRRIRRYGRS